MSSSERLAIARDVARAVEQQPLPVGKRGAAELRARLVREVRRAEKLALQVVGPAMDRADDVLRVALAREHDRLPVTADVRQELDALRTVDERLRVAARGEHLIVTRFGRHQRVADVTGPAGEELRALGIENRGIAVDARGEL